MINCIRANVDYLGKSVNSLFQPEEITLMQRMSGRAHYLFKGYLGTQVDERIKLIKIIDRTAIKILKQVQQFIKLFQEEKPEPTVWENLYSFILENKGEIVKLAGLIAPSSGAVQALELLSTIQTVYQSSYNEKAKDKTIEDYLRDLLKIVEDSAKLSPNCPIINKFVVKFEDFFQKYFSKKIF